MKFGHGLHLETAQEPRNYEVWDTKGNLIVQSISYWMVIDFGTRKPTRIPKDILTRRFSDRPHTLEPTKNHLRAFDPTEAEQEITMQVMNITLI